MDCYQFIDIDSKFGVGRSSVPEKSDFDRNSLGVLVQPPVLEYEYDTGIHMKINVHGIFT